MLNLNRPVIILAFVLGAVLFGSRLVFSFTEPASAPPSGNISSPLNVSGAGQSKSGGLILNTGGAANGLIIDQGKVGIGTQGPNFKLDIQNGDINVSGKIKEGGNDLIPQGAVLYFNKTGCPSGWSELTAARGRYIVGLNTGGSLLAVIGTALSDGENRATGKHNHVYDVWLSAEGQTNLTHAAAAKWNGTPERYAALDTTFSGSVDGTNAPYIQLLACQKN